MDTLEPILEPLPELERYHLESQLASGIQTEVWLACRDDGLRVAIKVARAAEHRAVLLQEIRALSRTDHPGVVKMIDHAENGAWLALQVVDALPMDQWARERPLPEMIPVWLRLLDAIAHLHEHGITHCDIKPANALVDAGGQPVVVDLNAAFLDGDERFEFLGTLGYAAPELLRGAKPGLASDLYSFGALLYLCVTGRLPFLVDAPAALTYLPLASLPSPPSTWNPEIPSRLEHLLLDLLARDPQRRLVDLGEIRRRLAEAIDSPLSVPIIGMHAERDELRRAVVATADGESRIVVVYGPPGSGRSTLIREALVAARREGLATCESADLSDVVRTVEIATRPLVCLLDASWKGAVDLVRAPKRQKQAITYLIRSDRTLPVLSSAGARQITPPLLDREDSVRLVQALGGDPDMGMYWWREAHGLPVGLVGRFRAWSRARSGAPFDRSILPEPSRRILEAIETTGEASIADLSTKLAINEHSLLDHCEVLFAEGVVQPSPDGIFLEACV